MIHIINYGLGNLGSVSNMLSRIGEKSKIVSTPEQLKGATKLILPGVGAFDTGMNHLRKDGWIEPITELVLDKKMPVLGICLGMQLMTKSSEEGAEGGLGWVDAQTVKFPSTVGRIPHMGWNVANVTKKSKLVPLDELGERRFYFVHSYYVKLRNQTDEFLSTAYGISFSSGYEVDNLLGVQFHPEKSHRFGMSLLTNFARNF